MIALHAMWTHLIFPDPRGLHPTLSVTVNSFWNKDIKTSAVLPALDLCTMTHARATWWDQCRENPEA
ncbi:hypothetical protein Pelo_19568 [Pelomyxa schiedti]|nr:hypothetical protein Pelo_19568 [Pelomyxa schiedti]